MTADSPAGTGVVDVTVDNQGGQSATSPADQFSYGPTVTSLTPNSGSVAGGTFVIITGVNWPMSLRSILARRQQPVSSATRPPKLKLLAPRAQAMAQ